MSREFEVGVFTNVFDPSRGGERWYINDHTIFRDHGGTWHLIGITPPMWAPHVVHHNGTYWMFYCGGGTDKEGYAINLATSSDGWTWTRHPANPLVVDGYEARDPMVIGGRGVMYYTATLTPAGGSHIVAAAESDDLISWRGRHVVYEDEMQGTFAGPTESPFVVARSGAYYLFIGPDWKTLVDSHARSGRWDIDAYRRTRVFRSADPLRFSADDCVGELNAHAAEVVVDENGTYSVTHCGWGQGGVHLAPLRWRS